MAANAAQKAVRTISDDLAPQAGASTQPQSNVDGSKKILEFPTTEVQTPTNTNFTKLSDLDLYSGVAFNLSQLNQEQKEILQTTFANLWTILNETKPEYADDYWSTKTFLVLSPYNRLEVRTPYLGNRPDNISEIEFKQRYLPPSRLLSLTLALARLFSVPLTNNTPDAALSYMKSWGAVKTIAVDDGEVEGINELVVRKHLSQISNFLAVTQVKYQQLFPPTTDKDDKTEGAEDVTEIEKPVSTAVVPPSSTSWPKPNQQETEGGGETQEQSDTNQEARSTSTQVADQRFNLAAERERLTIIALNYYCVQWNIEPTDEIRQLVRNEFIKITSDQADLDLKSISNRFRLLEQLTMALGHSPEFVNWLQREYEKVDSSIHNTKLKQEFAEFRKKITFDPNTNTAALTPISQETLTDPVASAAAQLSNLLADVSGGPLNPTALSGLTDVIESYAIGFGMADGTESQFDFAAFLTTLTDEQLVTIIFAGDVSSTNSKELLAAVKKRRKEIEAILVAGAGEMVFTLATTASPYTLAGAYSKLGLDEEIKRDPTGSTATAFRQLVTFSSSPEVVSESIEEKHTLSNSKKEAQDYIRQLQKTWVLLPLAVQKQVYVAWGKSEEDFEASVNPEGTQAKFIDFTGLPIEKFIANARKSSEQHHELLVVLAAYTNQQTSADKQELLVLLDSVEKFITKTEAANLRRQINKAFVSELSSEQHAAVKNLVINQRKQTIDSWAAQQEQAPSLTSPVEIQTFLANSSQEDLDQLPSDVLEYLQFFANQTDVSTTAVSGEVAGEVEVGEIEIYVQPPTVSGAEEESETASQPQTTTEYPPGDQPPEFDWGDIAPEELVQASAAYNQQLSQGNIFTRLRNRRKKINQAKIAAQAVKKTAEEAAKKAGQEAVTTAAAAAAGPVGWAAKAALIANQLRTKEGRKKLKQQLLAVLGGGVMLGAALMGFLGEVGGGIVGALGGGGMGAGIGAFIGTFIFPGVGTTAGALVGSLIGGTGGAFLGKSAGAKFAAQNALGGTTISAQFPSVTPRPTPGLFGSSPSPTGTPPASSYSSSSYGQNPPPGGGSNMGGQVSGTTPPPGSTFNPQSGTAIPGQPPVTPDSLVQGGGAGTTGAAATGAALGGIGVLIAAPFGLATAAAWMPLLSVGALMFISLYTLYTIFAAFLSPIPVGTTTSPRDGSGNQYLNLKKTVAPNQIPNIEPNQPTPVTYTILITAKAGYQIKLLDATDVMKSLPERPNNRDEKKAVWVPANIEPGNPYLTKSSFAPMNPGDIITGQAQAQYVMKFTEGANALVTNSVTIKYDVLKTTGETVVTNQTFTDYSSLRIGNPKVLCWPTTGIITQLPYCLNKKPKWSHCEYRANAYDIANNSLPDVFAPVDGVARRGPTGTLLGNFVSLEFFLPTNNTIKAELIFAHLGNISPNITENTNTPISVGQRIGRMGSTGNSTGPHLHYELRPIPNSLPQLNFLPLLPGGQAPLMNQTVQTCYGN